MPLELSELPEEVQVAFFMFSLLPDHWEGMSGTYMGKYWDGLDYFFKLYGPFSEEELDDIEDQLNVIPLINAAKRIDPSSHSAYLNLMH